MTTPFPFTLGQTLTAAQLNAITTLPLNDQTASYVAVVGDVGKRIVMNVASANTVTINNSVFATGDTIFIANKGAGATTVTAGVGVTINTAGSLVITQHGGGTLVATSASVFTFFSGAGNSFGVATGGTPSSITVGGLAYTLLTFSSSDTLTVTKAGLFDVLLIGGGGGGGNAGSGQSAGTGSGGGAGGIMVGSVFLSANTTVTVGAKGLGAASSTSGSLSRLGTTTDDYTATGGVAVAGNNFSAAGNSGTGQRFAQNTALGGGGAGGVAFQSSAGGGGTGGVATSGSGGTGGAGGAGTDISPFITGATALRAGGGGGGGISVGGAGGSGGGGNGAVSTNAGSNATLKGSGGGGAACNPSLQNRDGGNGSDGIVFIRFKV